MRDEDEYRSGWRLFQSLEQRVGGVLVHVLGRVHESHAQPAAVRPDVEEIGELAHLVDLDFDAGLLRAARGCVFLGLRRRILRQRLGLEATKVRVVPGEVPAAGGAGIARFRRTFAQKELRGALRERQLSDALRPVEEQRMRQPLHAPRDRIEDRLVPGMHQSSERWRSSALRISGTAAAASTTRTRFGSRFARARYSARTRSKKARSSRSKRSSGFPDALRRSLAVE